MPQFRLISLAVLLCLLFAVAVGRLGQLQYYMAAELISYRENRLRHAEQRAPRRGRILDIKGRVLAEDQPTHDLWIVPVRQERQDGRRRYVSNLPPLSPEQMLSLASARGGEKEFDRGVALASLADASPLVETLSEKLKLEKREVAEAVIDSVASSRSVSMDDLLYPKVAIPEVEFSAALEFRTIKANPYADPMWKAVEMRIGGRRNYPGGKDFGHITGAVGRLSAEEYTILRGRWDGDDKIPGKGKIVKQGREFFSVLPDQPIEGQSDEEAIIRLREVKRQGKMVRASGSFMNETVGRGGIEQQYNQALRGRHALQPLRLAKDEESRRRVFAPVGRVERARNGADVTLSVDMDIQHKVMEILKKHLERVSREHRNWEPSGVAILMNPHNGRIHALASIPSYDPNTFAADFAKLLKDPANPLLDRAIAGIYPPGSVVKPLVGLAALCEDKIAPGEKVFCDHILMLGGAKFTCLGRHGHVDMEAALMHSCNIYFYHAGEMLGGRRLYDWYTRLGLGHRTGIDLAGESPGLLPTAAYTRKGWATGNTYHLAIGQGMAATPLQLAVAYCAIANCKNGVAKIVRPHFLIPGSKEPRTPEEAKLSKEAFSLDQPMAEVQVDKEAIEIIRQGMWDVVQGTNEAGIPAGTGQLAAFRSLGGFLIELGGKTGTAEWSKNVRGHPVKQPDHVWFAGYAPFDRPEVVVVVMLPAAAGGGGYYCAPIAKEILRVWFNLPEKPDVFPDQEEDAVG